MDILVLILVQCFVKRFNMQKNVLKKGLFFSGNKICFLSHTLILDGVGICNINVH